MRVIFVIVVMLSMYSCQQTKVVESSEPKCFRSSDSLYHTFLASVNSNKPQEKEEWFADLKLIDSTLVLKNIKLEYMPEDAKGAFGTKRHPSYDLFYTKFKHKDKDENKVIAIEKRDSCCRIVTIGNVTE